MLTAIIIFGLRLGPLYNAIAKVESDRGATSANIYQVRSIYVDDLNRLYPSKRYRGKDVLDRDKSKMMMYLYWSYYGSIYARKTNRPVTYEVLARIHNGGPDGWKKRATAGYWKRVQRDMKKGAK